MWDYLSFSRFFIIDIETKLGFHNTSIFRALETLRVFLLTIQMSIGNIRSRMNEKNFSCFFNIIQMPSRNFDFLNHYLDVDQYVRLNMNG